MTRSDAILFPIAFGGAVVGLLGMLCAPDGLTGGIAALLFVTCALFFGALLIWYPSGGTREE